MGASRVGRSLMMDGWMDGLIDRWDGEGGEGREGLSVVDSVFRGKDTKGGVLFVWFLDIRSMNE